MRRPPLYREVELLTALGLGQLLNLCVGVAMASAGTLETAQAIGVSPALAGAMGGLVGGLVHLAGLGLMLERTAAERGARTRHAIGEAAFSVVVGAIVAHYWTRPLAHLIPGVDPTRDLQGVAFGLGLAAWRGAPGVFATLRIMSQPASLKAWLGGLLEGWARKIVGSGDRP